MLVIIVTSIIIIIMQKKNNVNNAIAMNSANTKNNSINVISNTNQELTQTLSDNTKYNISNKLKETKMIDGMEIGNIQLTEKNGVTLLLATVTNKTNTVAGDFKVKIKVLDKDGKEITTTYGYIKLLQPGETTQLSVSKTFDYANAYDFEISKE